MVTFIVWLNGFFMNPNLFKVEIEKCILNNLLNSLRLCPLLS